MSTRTRGGARLARVCTVLMSHFLSPYIYIHIYIHIYIYKRIHKNIYIHIYSDPPVISWTCTRGPRALVLEERRLGRKQFLTPDAPISPIAQLLSHFRSSTPDNRRRLRREAEIRDAVLAFRSEVSFPPRQCHVYLYCDALSLDFMRTNLY